MPNYGGVRTSENRDETSFGLPVGSVMAWNAPLGTTLPVGWVICDGAPYFRTSFPLLFSLIGTAHGDGTKTAAGGASGIGAGLGFNAPDYRSTAHRGHNGGTTTDFGPRTAQNTGGSASGTGSFESHSIMGHWHIVYGTIRAERYDTIRPPTYLYSNIAPGTTFYGAQGRTAFTGANGVVRQGKESRGHNVSVTFLIRAS